MVIINALRNKKGFSYILVCVIIIFVVMVVFVAMQYAYVYHIAEEQKNETQLKLDGFVTRTAVEQYDALKQGEAWVDYVDRNDLVDGAYYLLGFPTIITLEYREPIAVAGKYYMSRPTIYALAGDAFGVYVQYEIEIPYVVLLSQKNADECPCKSERTCLVYFPSESKNKARSFL